ncbi:MAG: hypothetical protein CUN49_17320, partial [Candidatus Thermofonsia Clade 1 bacterium]
YVEQAALYFARGESPKALENLRTALTFPRVQRDQALRTLIQARLAEYSATATPRPRPDPVPTVVTPPPRPDPVPTATPTSQEDDDDDDRRRG